MKLFLKFFNYLVTGVLVLVIAAAAGLGFSARLSKDQIPTWKGYRMLTVLSGSMEPNIDTGDAIVVKDLGKGEKVKEGDIITFRAKEKQSMIITHRVVGTILVNGVPKAYVTKGDANVSQDFSTVSPDQIMGRYYQRVPYFGYVSSFIHKPVGIVVCVIIPGLVLIGFEFKKIWKLLAENEKSDTTADANTTGGERTEV